MQKVLFNEVWAMHSATIAMFIILLFTGGCVSPKKTRPLLPVDEYEKMVVGRLDAEYVGTDNCVAKCHRHDKITNFFRHSVHGEQIKPETKMPLVNCESCHGPGAMHAASGGEKARIIGPSTWTQEQATGFCLACHVKTVKLRFWYGSAHQRAGLMCHDCHKVSFSRVENDRLVFKGATLMEACIRCHAEKRIALTQRSRHPLRDSTRPDFEGNMTCVDCHNPHGSVAAHLIDADSINDKCWQCHMEKRFPLQDGHPAAAEDCMDCHTPHGSNFPNLLRSGL